MVSGTVFPPLLATVTGDDQIRQAIRNLSIAKIYGIFDLLSKWMLVFGLIIGVIFLLLGAISLIRSHGDAGQAEEGKKTILWAAVGIALVVVARGVVLLIGNFFT